MTPRPVAVSDVVDALETGVAVAIIVGCWIGLSRLIFRKKTKYEDEE